MTDRPFDQTSDTAAPMAGQRGEAMGSRRKLLIAFGLVALVSLALGVGGTLLALRYWSAVSPAGTVAATEQAGATGQPAEHAGMPGMEQPSPASQHPTEAKGTTVYISPARQQLIGVRTAEVSHRALETTVRTVGTLAYDETRVTQIHTKIAGWVEKLDVDYVGRRVRRGEPLFSVYSPELVSTQTEYLLALRGLAELKTSQFPETRAAAESLVASTRDRLKLWDITDAQIDELERTREPRRTLTLYSPFDGIVLERNVFAGQYITPETATFKIADLSTIWVLGQIFEYELPLIQLGQEAAIEFPYAQSTRRLTGKITYVYPDVDPATRRVKVRMEFRNPGLEFKPESYVTVVLRASGGLQLAIPKEAVIDTGVKRYALLAHPNGYFEPREVEVGQPVDEFYPVLKGLEHGDTVVTSAQFLIDSETNLQAAMQSMAGMHGSMEMGGGGREGMEMPQQAAPAKPSAPQAPPGAKPQAPSGHEGHQPAKPPEDRE